MIVDLERSFLAFRDQCIWIRTCFDTNRALFGAGEARRDVMRRTAASFFGELNHILLENYIVQVCKVTDPARSGPRGDRRENLTVALLDSMLRERGLMSPEIQAAGEEMMRYRALVVDARNRSIAHFDKETVLTFLTLGRHTRQEAEAFIGHMHAYVDAIALAAGIDPLDFRSTAGPGDAADLFRALNGGAWVPEEAEKAALAS